MNHHQKAQQLYRNKKILILGLGSNQGGVGATRFFAEAGAKLRVTDLKTKEELQPSVDELSSYSNIEYIFGQHRFKDIDWADLIIRNPALKPDNSYLQYAAKKSKTVEMDLGILLQFISTDRLIGVTGTKGKSTTASLIYEALQAGHIKVALAGNIGKSMLDSIYQLDDQTYLVLELSSFQLQALKTHHQSPKRAVITNIYPDHLNYHGSMEDYAAAKKLIAQYQKEGDYLFLGSDDEVTSSDKFTKDLKTQKIYCSSADLPANYQPILIGEHNKDNIACAVAVAKTFQLGQQSVLDQLKKFAPVEFRMQLIKEYQGVKIYNDTTATMPKAAEEDIKSLPGAIVIAGGMDKGLSYSDLAKVLDQYPKAVYFLVGDATDKMKGSMQSKDKIKGEYENLENLVKDVLTATKPGDTILFCPGATSFNLFKNEFDRGRQFNAVVEKLTS